MLCSLVRRVKISFADPRRSYTRAFERYALDLSKHMAIKDVSRHLGVSWDVIKLYNDKLTNLRRELHRNLTDELQKKVLKGTRWLLLKNPENLNDDKNEKDRLQDALKINAPLSAAYYLKEDLRQIWDQGSKDVARNVLVDWVKRAKASGVKMLTKFAKTLMAHATGILNYYDYPISTGPLEGTNNKIKTLQRQAYGFRDMEFFKLKIYDLHSTKYAFVG